MYEFFQSLIQNLANAISSLFTWLGGVLQSFFNALKEALVFILTPIINVFQWLLYTLSRAFLVVIWVLQVIYGLFKVLISIVYGVFNTFYGLLAFSGSTSYYILPEAYQEGWNQVANLLNGTGFSTIALIMAVFVWLMTAYAFIRIAGGEK